MSRSKRKRSLRENVLRRIQKKYPRGEPGEASKYLDRLREYHKKHPDMVAILYNRESTGLQGYKRNHDTHQKVLRWACNKRGIPVVHFYSEDCTGKILYNYDRQALFQAVKKARAINRKGKHAVILATSSDRFLRNINFHTKDFPNLLPTKAEFEKLRELARGIPLVTLLNPDMPWKKVRGYHSKWGQRVKRKKGAGLC